MSKHDEEKSPRQSLPGMPARQSFLDWGERFATDADGSGASNGVAKFEEAKRRRIDTLLQGVSGPEDLIGTVAKKEQKVNKQEQAEAKLKSARTKRSKVQSADDASGQAETVIKQKQKSTRKTPKVSEPSGQAASTGDNMPPITSAAIEFLGKQTATAADLLELGVDSLAFVQYHFKHMQQLAVDSALTKVYLKASGPPISPALKKLFDELIKRRPARSSLAHEKGGLEGPVKERQQTTDRLKISYHQNTATIDAYAAIAMQFGKPKETKKKQESAVLQGLENSIERGVVQLITAAQFGSTGSQTPKVQQPIAGEQYVNQQIGSEVQSKNIAPDSAPRSNLSRRVMLAIRSAPYRVSSIFSAHEKEERAPRAKSVTLNESAATNFDDKSTVVPATVLKRFLKVECEYYFQDRTPAFSDRGNKLSTRGTNREVLLSLIEIAQARGWESITLNGTEEFRRTAWREAAQKGVAVAGYKPTTLDLADLLTRPADTFQNKKVIDTNAKSKRPAAQRQTGTAESLPAAVTTTFDSKKHRESLEPAAQLAEKLRAFQGDSPTTAVKKYPDLATAYGIVAAANAFSLEKLPESAREEFVQIARLHIVQKMTCREDIKGPKIYLPPTQNAEVSNKAIVAQADLVEKQR